VEQRPEAVRPVDFEKEKVVVKEKKEPGAIPGEAS